jgi:hypothetical protein
MKILPRVATEMALHVLTYNPTRVINIIGPGPPIAAIKSSLGSENVASNTVPPFEVPTARTREPSSYHSGWNMPDFCDRHRTAARHLATSRSHTALNPKQAFMTAPSRWSGRLGSGHSHRLLHIRVYRIRRGAEARSNMPVEPLI